MPHLTTLFYVLEDGKLAFWTYGASQKAVNLRRDPRITCLVENGEDYFELRGVSILGRARLIEEYDDIRVLGSRVARRMAVRRPRRLRVRGRGEAGPQTRRHRGRAVEGDQLGPQQDGRPARGQRRLSLSNTRRSQSDTPVEAVGTESSQAYRTEVGSVTRLEADYDLCDPRRCRHRGRRVADRAGRRALSQVGDQHRPGVSRPRRSVHPPPTRSRPRQIPRRPGPAVGVGEAGRPRRR